MREILKKRMSFHGIHTLNFLEGIFNIYMMYIIRFCDIGGLFTNAVDSCLTSTANSGPPESNVLTKLHFLLLRYKIYEVFHYLHRMN